jgi:mevalonate kinase
MKDLEKKYSAKLMLAGEYGVLAGSEAMTVPLKGFYARLASMNDSSDEKKKVTSTNSLRKLFSYIESLPRNSFYANPEIQQMNELLKTGYFIESNIPQGYGIGSSGAVSALIYDQFFKDHSALNLQQQQKDLASLESFFHGKSSGVDALTCFTGASLHFLEDKKIKILDKNPLTTANGYRFFLLDSKTVFETAPLVKEFLEMMEDDNFSSLVIGDYSEMIKKFIASLTGKLSADTALIFRAISDFQWNHFRRMIPEKMEDIWINGQVSNTYYLKLNGSGGGFMLGIAAEESMEAMEGMLEGFDIMWL